MLLWSAADEDFSHMKASSGDFLLSASDLGNHLACRHLTFLDFGVAVGERSAPEWHLPDLWVLQKRGLEHENAYVAHLAAQGLSVVDLRSTSQPEANSAVIPEQESNYLPYLAAEGSSVVDLSDPDIEESASEV